MTTKKVTMAEQTRAMSPQVFFDESVSKPDRNKTPWLFEHKPELNNPKKGY